MTNSEILARVFPEIKDPEAAAVSIQIGLGPGMDFEMGWFKALHKCRLYWESNKEMDWRRSGMITTYNWACGAVKYNQIKPIEEPEKPFVVIDKDLSDGF